MTTTEFNIEKKEEKPVKTCLYKRFGTGEHIIRHKNTGKYERMIICISWTDVLFINENGGVNYMKSENEKIEYEDFDKYYEYIGKAKKIIVEGVE